MYYYKIIQNRVTILIMKKIIIFLILTIGIVLVLNLKTTPSNGILITDKSKLFSFETPVGWKIVTNEGSNEFGQLSNLSLESNDWKMHEDSTGDICRTTYIDSGANIYIFAQNGSKVGEHRGEGGGVDVGVTKEELILVDGTEGIYHEYKEFCTAQGLSMDVHLVRGGKSYHIIMNYNPDKFVDANETFIGIVNSFKFKD